MICPQCRSHHCRRSRRRGLKDYAIGLTGLRPWRCTKCDRRFFAGAVALRYTFVAHCNLCGNFDLQRIASEYGTGWFAWVFRLARVPVYRCAPCRNRFFSLRPRRNIVPVEGETPTETQAQVGSK